MHILTGGIECAMRLAMRAARWCAMAAMIVILAACEQNVDVELPYQERIVVNGFVGIPNTGSIPRHIHITRTLPPLADADTTRLRIADVTAEIVHRGIEYQLQPTPDPTQLRVPVEAEQWVGDTVSIRVRGGGMTALATTYIPARPTIHKVTVADSITEWGSDIKRIRVTVQSEFGSSIIAWLGGRVPLEFVYPMSVWERPILVPGPRRAGIGEITIDMDYYSSGTHEQIPLYVYAMDGAFARYRSSYTSGGGPFSSGGSNPWFNVSGDGIGMFVGASVTIDTVRIP